MDTAYLAVAPIPPIPGLDTLSYRVPAALAGRVELGMRVLVPLGRRRVTGLVVALDARPPEGVKIKDVEALLDDEPIATASLLELLRWIAEYYCASLAEVVSLAVGRGLVAESRRFVRLTGDDFDTRDEREQALVCALGANGGELEIERLRATTSVRGFERVLARLADRGIVRIEARIVEPKTRARTEAWVEIAGEPDEALGESLFRRAPKRRELFEHIAAQPARRVAVRELMDAFGNVSSQISALVAAGVLRRFEREVYRDLPLDLEDARHERLSEEQQRAIAAIAERVDEYAPFLLQGVTASGKTEVYLQAVATVLERGRTALVLVPEISLTHQLVARLAGRFGATVAVLHSELSPGERFDQWRRIRRGEARIVVGARSAVLAPLERLGIVVVDEEHDAAYKQEEGIRYHGRDVAIVRARQAGCPIVLGSATPSMESWHHAVEGRYRHLRLPARVTASPLPRVEVVDLRGRDIVALGGLSEHLCTLMKRNFEAGGQTLLFLNRRGYAASLQCYACGAIVECDQCSVGMTLHRNEGRLRCHHCNAAKSPPPRCPECSEDALVAQGLGTQRIEHGVRAHLPDARIARIDRDVAGRKGVVRDLLARWRRAELDVLIGTQMISKGHDAPGVTLVGVVQADLSLGVPDFRAAERTFQLVSQVAGRAGRGEQRGRVIVQTYRPDHFAIAAAVRHDYETFARRELAERAELAYPPHTRMALLRFEGLRLADVERIAGAAAKALAGLARAEPGLIVRGPAPSPIERRKGRHRYQVQLRADKGRLVRYAAAECRRRLRDRAQRAGVRVILDIDPIDMM